MDSLKKITSRRFGIADRPRSITVGLIALLLVLGALGGEAGAAFSGSCADLAANASVPAGAVDDGATSCTIQGTIAAPALCPFTLTLTAQNLIFTGTGSPTGPGSISCSNTSGAGSGQPITIDVQNNGNMTMAVGSFITSENTSGAGNGGAISVTVSGDFLMQGPGGFTTLPNRCSTVAGACISSSDVAGGGGRAGLITIAVGNFPNTPPVGLFTMQPGSAVLANSTQGSGGEIIMTSGLEMSIDGVVRSFGGVSGTGAQGGGPITLKTGCALTITPDGVVSSEGFDPGADLVHLEGCDVVINGLVQSIARGAGGHALPNAGNRCNEDNLAGEAHPIAPAQDYTACVEIWGNNITINSIAPNNGEVNANGVRAPNRAWIDLLAQNNITINNDTLGNYSVHANSATSTNTNSFGGVITVKAGIGALTGTLTTSGEAVQANGTGGGSDGGVVTMQAASNVILAASLIEARGPNGNNTRGGTISVRSFNGAVTGNNGTGKLDAAGGVGGSALGVVTLAACALDPALSYGGTVTPAPAVINPAFPACGGQPAALTKFEIQLDCAVDCDGGDCIKRGRKFNDIEGKPGLADWQICAFDNIGTRVSCTDTTSPDGRYEFRLECGKQFTFCEVLKTDWTQTFPTLPSGDPTIVSCEDLDGPPGTTLGPVGYRETLVVDVPSENNDFGNFKENGCRQDDTAVCTISVEKDGPIKTLAAAYAAALSGDTICLFANTDENVVLGGNKTLTITQCTAGRVTALDNTKPVFTISSTGKLIIKSPEAQGGSIGWLITTDGHELKSVRSTDASLAGIKIMVGADNNEVSFNSVSGSQVGVLIEGSFNTVKGGTVSGNGTGVQLSSTANNNTFKTATVRDNIGAGGGILVQGDSNTLSDNKVYGNTGNGFTIATGATGNKLKNNQSGGEAENGGAEYQLNTAAIDEGGNKADGLKIPEQKCGFFAGVGTCE